MITCQRPDPIGPNRLHKGHVTALQRLLPPPRLPIEKVSFRVPAAQPTTALPHSLLPLSFPPPLLIQLPPSPWTSPGIATLCRPSHAFAAVISSHSRLLLFPPPPCPCCFFSSSPHVILCERSRIRTYPKPLVSRLVIVVVAEVSGTSTARAHQLLGLGHLLGGHSLSHRGSHRGRGAGGPQETSKRVRDSPRDKRRTRDIQGETQCAGG